MASSSCNVISDSIKPTSAIARAYGAMIDSVSHVSGRFGTNNSGRLFGSSP